MGEQAFGLVLPREDVATHHIAGPEGATRKGMWPKGIDVSGGRQQCRPPFCFRDAECHPVRMNALFKSPSVPAEGIEPPTFGLQNRCTTAVLSRRTRRVGRPYYQTTPNVQPSVRAISSVRGKGVQSTGFLALLRIQAAVSKASA